jgi:hypothetical protein
LLELEFGRGIVLLRPQEAVMLREELQAIDDPKRGAARYPDSWAATANRSGGDHRHLAVLVDRYHVAAAGGVLAEAAPEPKRN